MSVAKSEPETHDPAKIETVQVRRLPAACELSVSVRREGKKWFYGYAFKAPATPATRTLVAYPAGSDRRGAILAGLERVEKQLLLAAKSTGPAEVERLEKMAERAARTRRDFEGGGELDPLPPPPAKRTANQIARQAGALPPVDAGAMDLADDEAAAETGGPAGQPLNVEGIELTIDPEFEALCPRQTPEEESLLENSLVREGCRDKVIAWQRGDDLVVVDGHTRLRKCRELSIDYKVQPVNFADRNAALNWIIANQLGRRNLADEQKSYLRGKRYQSEKQQVGSGLTAGPKARKSSSGNSYHSKTAEKLAAEYGVAEKTIRSDADFAAGVDKIAEVEGPEARQEILAGKSKRTKREVIAQVKPETAKPKAEPAAPKDPRLNEHGVFVKGVETLKIKTPAGTKAEIRVIEAAAGDWRYASAVGCRAESSSGPVSLRGKACSSRERAIEAAAKTMLHWAGIHGKSAGSAKEAQLAAGLHKAIEKFLRDQVSARRDVEIAADRCNLAVGVQVPPWAADLRAETVGRLHAIMDAAARQLLKDARKGAGKNAGPLTPDHITTAAAAVFTPVGGRLAAILREAKKAGN